MVFEKKKKQGWSLGSTCLQTHKGKTMLSMI